MGATMNETDQGNQADSLSLKAVPRAAFIRLMHSAGAQFLTENSLETDRQNGAPLTEQGPIDLIAYAAWLAKESRRGP